MTILFLVAALTGIGIISRGLMLLFFAEMGRKHDLIKHIYKSGTDFQIAIVVPYLDSRKNTPLQELMRALDRQDYPRERVAIHVIATEETRYGLPEEQTLPENATVWHFPGKASRRGPVVSWMVDRLLAQGGPSRLFVFLDADDIVRPDFLRNVTTRAFDCFAMQGYIALKRPPKGLLASVVALSNRFVNRVENAGRFHMGLSSRLMNSGWVVRQELLEMIPYRQGFDLDNLEYTIQLNLSGYRVNWAPNVVIYKDERKAFVSAMKESSLALLNRIGLAFRYMVPLLFKGLTRFNVSLLELAWSVVKPPHFVIGLVAVGGFLATIGSPYTSQMASAWLLFAVAYLVSQILMLAVARCSLKDMVTFLVATPLVYLAGLASFPFFLVTAFADTLLKRNAAEKKVRIGRRFDETRPSAIVPKEAFSFAGDDAPYQEDETPVAQAWDTTGIQPAEQTIRSIPPAESLDSQVVVSSPQKNTTILPISNGRQQVNCTVHSYSEPTTDGARQYYLICEYKTLAFTTQKYRILDQAYYELQTRLQAKGFTLVSCGSCAYFYRPTAGAQMGRGENDGFCIYGKMGQDISVTHEAITVLSSACQHYEDSAHRAEVVQAWQQSLEHSPLPS